MTESKSSVRRSWRVLIVEDDRGFSEMLQAIVTEKISEPTVCHDLASASDAILKKRYDLVLLDNHLPDGKGYDFHTKVQRFLPDAVSIMVTGIPELSQAITLTRNGLFEYLTKPIDVAEFTACLDRALMRLETSQERREEAEVLGGSPSMREVAAQLTQASKHLAATVLLTGESGVGKDHAARALHQMTYREKGAPMIALNCAAVPTDMFEAELFGAEKGAYTGAERKRQGLIEAAEGGTLFLDEIGEVPLNLQAKLLRFLESREYRSLGSTKDRIFNGRVVAATNKDLRAEVDAGRFREDLLYRVDVFAVALPALRERKEDLPELFTGILKQIAEKYGRAVPLVKPEDMARLQTYDYPGNVRELRNIIERSLLRSDPEDSWLTLDQRVFGSSASAAAAPTVAASAAAVAPAAPAAPAVADSGVQAPDGLSALEKQEFNLIRETLVQTSGGIRRAASSLGLTPQSLLRRLQKWPELRELANSGKSSS